jgi:hypothetical protein
MMEEFRGSTAPHVLEIAEHVWNQRNLFVQWPQRDLCFLPGSVRISYHQYPSEQREQLRQARITPDSRSNGPAIMAFLLAGGERPQRSARGRQWSVHHIYDGKFPAPGRSATAHAVRDPQLFTRSAGLVAVHPIADALADEVAYFAWLLRREAFERFQFDPDGVFKDSALFAVQMSGSASLVTD